MAQEKVILDYGFTSREVLGEQGVDPGSLNDQTSQAHAWLGEQRAAGRLGFMDLPGQGPAELEPIFKEAERLKSLADTLVVLGIGGSALGATAVDMALAGTLRNAAPRPGGAMRLLVADNPEPRAFGQLLDLIDLKRTAVNVISKSGTTAETMAQFLVLQEQMEKALGQEETRKRTVFTTDPEKGNLRLIAGREPVSILNVPPNVGGRYSVLSAVGLLPLACAGHDIKALLAGAADMAKRCQAPTLADNPAYMFASLAVAYMYRGRNVLVMMPYMADLFGLAQWFAQLWAESLGKAHDTSGTKLNQGQTPVAATGPTDQHSQLQLYMEGPQDKLVVLLMPEDYKRIIYMPDRYPDIDSLAYLGGQTLCKLASSECRATAAALASAGRPSMTLLLPELNAYHLGGLLQMLETATVFAGGIMGIDPLDQPGVEMGKRLTYGLMGRPGFEQEAQNLAKLDTGERFRV
jgi:glucose-6-phosphate isomerase